MRLRLNRHPGVGRLMALFLLLACLGWVPGETAPGWRYWRIETMPVPYFVQDTAASVATWAESAVTRGIDQWGGVPTAYLAFSYQGLSADLIGRSSVRFGDLGGNQTGGYSTENEVWLPMGRSFPVRFTVNIDDNCGGSTWPGPDNMSKTAAHELGHALSLDHTPIADAVMYYANHTHWTLHQDEIDATSFLHAYPARRPIAWFTTVPAPAMGMLRIATPATVTFDASPSLDPDGTIVEYRWTFADGQTAVTTEPTVDHDYALGLGFVQPTLEVVDDDGAFDRIRAVAILPMDGPDTAVPVVTITAPTTEPSFSTSAPTISVTATYSDDLLAYSGYWESDQPMTPPPIHTNLFPSGTSGTVQVDDIPLVVGDNTITVFIEDYPGNFGSDALVVTRLAPGDDGGGTPGDDGAADGGDLAPPTDPGGDGAADPASSDPGGDTSPGVDASPADDAAANAVDDPGRQTAVASGCACTGAGAGALDLSVLALLALWLRTRRRRGRGCHATLPVCLALAIGSPLLPGCATEPAPMPEPPAAEDGTWHQRHLALWALLHAGDRATTETALAMLDDPDRRNRRAAAEILGYVADRGAAEVSAGLVRHLQDADPFVRQASITSLGQLQARQALPALLAFAPGDEWTELRRRAALVALESPESLSWLWHLRQSPVPSQRHLAALVMGLAGPAHLAEVAAMLGDDGETGRVIETGEPSLRGPERVRHGAAAALRHLEAVARVRGDTAMLGPLLERVAAAEQVTPTTQRSMTPE